VTDASVGNSDLFAGIDFEMNKQFWLNMGAGASLPFRLYNLIDIQHALSLAGISAPLHGDSLRGLVATGQLPPAQRDDDVIVGADVPFEGIFEVLKPLGFKAIRWTEGTLSVFRDERYVDIHRLSRPIEEGKLTQVLAHGYYLQTPLEAQYLLDDKWGHPAPSQRKRRYQRRLVAAKRRVKQVVRQPDYVLPFVKSRVNRTLKRYADSRRTRKVQRLDEQSFRQLLVDRPNSLNWEWRGEHWRVMGLAPDKTFGEFLRDFEGEGHSSPVGHIVEVDTRKCFPEPIQISRRFWRSGNNLFAYPYMYGFRHIVLPYRAVNLWIQSSRPERIYSQEYYESLPRMSDDDVARFLRNSPISVKNGCVTSGRHRAVSMLGRLSRGEKYIPMYYSVE